MRANVRQCVSRLVVGAVDVVKFTSFEASPKDATVAALWTTILQEARNWSLAAESSICYTGQENHIKVKIAV